MTNPARTWRFPRPLAEDWLMLSLIGWGVLLVVAAGIAIGIDWFGTLTGSVWLPASGAALWFTGFAGGYIAHQSLPMFVANGRTRRDTAIELGMLCAVAVPVLAAMITIGFALEWGLYTLLDWPLGEIEDRLFDAHSQLGLIFLDHLLALLLWTVGGALIGAAFYRGNELGLGAIAVALVLAAINGAGTGFTMGPAAVLVRLLGEPGWTPLAGIVVSVACIAVAAGLTWLVVRDTPIRPKT